MKKIDELKITKCVGEGQSECKRCAEIKGFNRCWVSMMYKIDGLEGCYCGSCVEEIKKEFFKSCGADRRGNS